MYKNAEVSGPEHEFCTVIVVGVYSKLEVSSIMNRTSERG
jgi:hypothetical protein